MRNFHEARSNEIVHSPCSGEEGRRRHNWLIIELKRTVRIDRGSEDDSFLLFFNVRINNNVEKTLSNNYLLFKN